MTTAFQYVIDNAESLSINKKKKVSQTISRSGLVKSISLGGQQWEFRVKLPDGPSWETFRPLIERIEALDRVTVGTIKINSAGHKWITGYQGNLTNVSNIVVSTVSGDDTLLNITSGATLVSGFKFRSGDLIQLGFGKVYSVVDDVPYNSTQIKVHRPIRENAGSYTLAVGQNVSWNVICTQLPNWTLFARNQVSWDGEFVFVEAS